MPTESTDQILLEFQLLDENADLTFHKVFEIEEREARMLFVIVGNIQHSFLPVSQMKVTHNDFYYTAKDKSQNTFFYLAVAFIKLLLNCRQV